MEEMLGNFGLRLGMTEEDLDAYMRFETEDDKDVTTIMRFEESEEVKWDQRRYEVARDCMSDTGVCPHTRLWRKQRS